MHDQRLAAYFFLQGTGSHREVNHELSSIVVFGKSLKASWKCEGIDFPHSSIRNPMDAFA